MEHAECEVSASNFRRWYCSTNLTQTSGVFFNPVRSQCTMQFLFPNPSGSGCVFCVRLIISFGCIAFPRGDARKRTHLLFSRDLGETFALFVRLHQVDNNSFLELYMTPETIRGRSDGGCKRTSPGHPLFRHFSLRALNGFRTTFIKPISQTV